MMSTLEGRDDIGRGADALDLALLGVGHAGEKVDQAAGASVGGLRLEHHVALLAQMVGDVGGVLKLLRLHQHGLQLGGGVDVDLLVAPAEDGS